MFNRIQVGLLGLLPGSIGGDVGKNRDTKLLKTFGQGKVHHLVLLYFAFHVNDQLCISGRMVNDRIKNQAEYF